MRLAYLTADFGVPVLGTKGASAHVRGLVEALRSEGHNLFVLAANIGEDADPSFPLRLVPFGRTLMEFYDALQHESVCAGARLAKSSAIWERKGFASTGTAPTTSPARRRHRSKTFAASWTP